MGTVKPDFLYIGAARSGSTYLYEVLRHHPEIFIPKARDLNFFSCGFKRGLKWYMKYFKHASCKIAGEIDHDYYLSAETMRRIYSALPKIKLICCLREPIGKIYSEYNFWRFTKIPGDISFRDYALLKKTIAETDYYNLLRTVFEIFPRDQILVLFYDELKNAPQDFIRKVLHFLEVSQDFENPLMLKKINPMRVPRSILAIKIAYKVYSCMKMVGLHNVAGYLKYGTMMNELFFDKTARIAALSPELDQELKPYYYANLKQLQVLLGQELPASWNV